MPRAWCDLTVSVKHLHCTMHCTWSSGRVIWPVWWLVTTIMAENSALEYVRRLIPWRGTNKLSTIIHLLTLDLLPSLGTAVPRILG